MQKIERIFIYSYKILFFNIIHIIYFTITRRIIIIMSTICISCIRNTIKAYWPESLYL